MTHRNLAVVLPMLLVFCAVAGPAPAAEGSCDTYRILSATARLADQPTMHASPRKSRAHLLDCAARSPRMAARVTEQMHIQYRKAFLRSWFPYLKDDQISGHLGERIRRFIREVRLTYRELGPVYIEDVQWNASGNGSLDTTLRSDPEHSPRWLPRVRLKNRSERSQNVKIRALLRGSEGQWFGGSPRVVTLPGNSSKTARLEVTLPEEARSQFYLSPDLIEAVRRGNTLTNCGLTGDEPRCEYPAWVEVVPTSGESRWDESFGLVAIPQ